ISDVLIDSNIISSSMLNPYFEDIAAFADYRFKKQKEDSENYDYHDRFLIALLGKFNNAQSNALLQKWLSINDKYLKLKCIEALLLNGQVIKTQPLLDLATDRIYRIDLYSALKKQNKQALFPKQYLTQQYFAESNIYAAASDEDEPSALTYLTQKIITIHGKKGRFFFYKITFGEDEKTDYLACAGPFDLNPLKLPDDESYGTLYFDEEFDKAGLQKQMNALIKQVTD
ncbi:MAG: hypothetical protein ABIN97_12045, partial [Ginsengibacter sp.]